MPSAREIADAMEEIAPQSLAAEWDNVGLLVNCGGDVAAALVCLDVTDEAVEEAQALQCRLIVAHHPVIFHPLRSLSRGDMPYRLVRRGLSVIAAHTNLDAAGGGVNDVLAGIFGLAQPAPFAGAGRVGRLAEDTTAQSFAALCAAKFGAPVRYADGGRPIRTLAVMGGSGGGLLGEAIGAGADCILTGEADHQDAIDARRVGVSLVLAGHFCTEFPVVPVLAAWLRGRFPALAVHVSRAARDPLAYALPEGEKTWP